MDDAYYKWFLALSGFTILTVCISEYATSVHKTQVELEAIKAGYVQKVESGKVLWTKEVSSGRDATNAE